MAEATKPVMTQLVPPERGRTYHFPDGSTVKLTDVTHFKCSDSGTHRLRTGDGHLHVVPTGWNHIEIDADDWTL